MQDGMREALRDAPLIAAIAGGCSLIVGVLGQVLLRRLRRRSLPPETRSAKGIRAKPPKGLRPVTDGEKEIRRNRQRYLREEVQGGGVINVPVGALA